jgi:hemerythrin-like domain-containing protein
MATKLPSTGGCDTSDMLMIHGMFRKVLTDAPALVRSVEPGDREHTTAVADHLEDIASGLHNHHHGEDLLLWDQLAARAPACAAHVDQMRAQHAAVAALLEKLETLVPAWRQSASAAHRDAVAGSVEAVRDSLLAHLGAEETQILPVASSAFEQSEWNKLGEHGRASVPKDRRLIQLGYILDSMSPEDAKAWAKANLPAPVRLLYWLIGRRQYLAEYRSLHPEAV